MVAVLPGLPTAAEFFLLPSKDLTERKPEAVSAHLDQVEHNLIIHLYGVRMNITLDLPVLSPNSQK